MRRGDHIVISFPRGHEYARRRTYFVLKEFKRPAVLKSYRLWAKLAGERPNARRFARWLCDQGFLEETKMGTPWDMSNLWCATANYD